MSNSISFYSPYEAIAAEHADYILYVIVQHQDTALRLAGNESDYLLSVSIEDAPKILGMTHPASVRKLSREIQEEEFIRLMIKARYLCLVAAKALHFVWHVDDLADDDSFDGCVKIISHGLELSSAQNLNVSLTDVLTDFQITDD